ncbi:hypothetical protein [Streptacidiphilus carbonis]|uniref:hypothetical protein n=1 Tax=Streptacidiphilus carbonis TaxID=105422 RepID=UPI0005A6EAFB|nr:hypothetical protein [Streptacidiphilus carbonis]
MPATTHRPRTVILGTLAVAAAGTLIGVSWTDSASGTQQSVASTVQNDAAQLSAVKAGFTAAIQATRSVDAPPASALGPLAALANGQVAPQVGSSVRARQLTDGAAVLAQHFTPDQAKHEAVALHNAVSNEADPKFRNLGSGTSKVTFTQVGVAGATATVQAQVTVWAKFQQQQPDGKWTTANPANVMDYTATLVKNSAGHWIVSSLRGDFAPGEGP